jgi:chaperone required for assembly of F1-ATPase
VTKEDNESKGGPTPAKVPGRESLKPVLPKRFYKDAAVEQRDGKFLILLDGRGVKTPKKRDLALPTQTLADAIAVEWAEQGERIDPATMPLTRIANTAIDAVADHMVAVADDIQAFAGNDLTCYRAEGPEALVRRQSDAWDPVLDWAKTTLGADFLVVQGIVPIEQPASSIAAVGKAIEGAGPFRLAALHMMTTLTGSALIALAHALGRLTLEEAWAAAHVDETWQAEQWGWDAEAQARARHRKEEFSAASRALTLAE